MMMTTTTTDDDEEDDKSNLRVEGKVGRIKKLKVKKDGYKKYQKSDK